VVALERAREPVRFIQYRRERPVKLIVRRLSHYNALSRLSSSHAEFI
jgi:hypothetical protein